MSDIEVHIKRVKPEPAVWTPESIAYANVGLVQFQNMSREEMLERYPTEYQRLNFGKLD